MIPLILSTWSFGQRGNRAAWPALAAGGSALDAVERACIAVEEDPEVDSVGYGGLPDASGVVSLDASIMTGPTIGGMGAVAGVRRHLHVTTIARRVLEQAKHIFIVGDDADRFADEHGVEHRELLHDDARKKWEEWKTGGGADDESPDQSRDSGLGALRPVDRTGSGALFDTSGGHDTIGTLAIDASGTMAGACSTSGTPFKTPGRVGDSPIIGHGLYVLPGVAAATATGTGELIMSVCGSFLIVEAIQRGATPDDAIREALERIDRLNDLRPNDQAAFIAMTPSDEWSAGALRRGFKIAVCDHERDEIVDPAIVLRDD